MAGFMIKIESNNKWWYLLGAILFLATGVGMAVAGFAIPSIGISLGITGIVVAAVATIFLIDAIMNL
ncbi:MAG: hypothetical protein K0U72_01555 [Gammaproteobacteria bacterium]|nr:hypothetical protein [Gammaproteobacteria bacterium]